MENKPLILLAEDHPVNQKVALLLLNRFGYTAEAVDNGRQAFDAVKQHNYDLILMDVMMPEMDGFEATKLIRDWEKESSKHTPIIALTALAMVGDRERCLAAGMDDYITKPIDPPLLRSKINSWLRERELASNLTKADVDRLVDLDELKNSYGEGDMQEILELFLNVTSALLSELELRISNKDFVAVERIAHELKGSSAAIYARPLAWLCMRMEDAARKKEADAVSNLFPEISDTFASLKYALQQATKPTV